MRSLKIIAVRVGFVWDREGEGEKSELRPYVQTLSYMPDIR